MVKASMTSRPVAFAEAGRLEICWHHAPPTTYPEETHETVQVCVPMERALYSVTRQSETGGRLVHHLGARDVLVVPAGQPHSVTWLRPAEIVSFQMSQRFINEALGRAHLRLPDTLTLRDPFISAAAAEIRAALRAEQRPSPTFAGAIATVIAYRIGLGVTADGGFRGQENAPAFSSAQTARIDRFIAENIDQPITLGALAEQMNLSMWHFLRRFSASYGLTPHAYITQCRLARARMLLAESNFTITAIALEIGMSHSHFSRSFLKNFGIPPREFRRRRRC